MSKHDKDITWRISCDSIEQRERLKAEASELSGIMELQNAEMLEYLFDHVLPPKTYPPSVDGPNPPLERGPGATGKDI
jgi:hypothetical protein